MKIKIIKTHTVRNIWEAYAKKMLASNPSYYGKYHNKIHNFYIYEDMENGLKREVLSYKTFRKLVEQFFDRSKYAIIQGEAINVQGCGRICARRVERDFRKKSQKRVDWKKTMAGGKEWSEEKQKMVYKKVVYFLDPDWCRIGWYKALLTNCSVYEFSPTNSNSKSRIGFRSNFTDAIRDNKFLKYQYIYSPIKDYPKSTDTCSTQPQA